MSNPTWNAMAPGPDNVQMKGPIRRGRWRLRNERFAIVLCQWPDKNYPWFGWSFAFGACNHEAMVSCQAALSPMIRTWTNEGAEKSGRAFDGDLIEWFSEFKTSPSVWYHGLNRPIVKQGRWRTQDGYDAVVVLNLFAGDYPWIGWIEDQHGNVYERAWNYYGEWRTDDKTLNALAEYVGPYDL